MIVTDNPVSLLMHTQTIIKQEVFEKNLEFSTEPTEDRFNNWKAEIPLSDERLTALIARMEAKKPTLADAAEFIARAHWSKAWPMMRLVDSAPSAEHPHLLALFRKPNQANRHVLTWLADHHLLDGLLEHPHADIESIARSSYVNPGGSSQLRDLEHLLRALDDRQRLAFAFAVGHVINHHGLWPGGIADRHAHLIPALKTVGADFPLAKMGPEEVVLPALQVATGLPSDSNDLELLVSVAHSARRDGDQTLTAELVLASL